VIQCNPDLGDTIMAVKSMGQLGFADLAVAETGAGQTSLDEILQRVDWQSFARLLDGLRDRQSAGRPAYEGLVMFKALLLQALYGLSDRGLEEALKDRLSFRRFAGLSLSDAVPDHTALCRFRELLSASGLLERLFVELDRQLDVAGLILRKGTLLDATIIESTAARPPLGSDKSKAQDPEARFVRKAGHFRSFYGYKAHVAVDQGSGLVRKVITTPANVHDTHPADALVCGDERAVLADSAYRNRARVEALRQRGIRPWLIRRAGGNRPPLTDRMKKLNRMISIQRAAVETTFATWKRRMGLARIKYRGLAKATAQVLPQRHHLQHETMDETDTRLTQTR
jgi:transposase, IS5 family